MDKWKEKFPPIHQSLIHSEQCNIIKSYHIVHSFSVSNTIRFFCYKYDKKCFFSDIEYKVGIKKLPVECIVSSIRDHMKCYTRNGWRRKAQVYCNSTHGMVVRNNMGILLQCGTDSFSAVEFVCCPKEQDKDIIGNEFDNYDPQIEYPKDFYLAVKNVGTYIPPKMEDCDQTIYSRLRTQLEDVYRKKHFKLDFEYYKAEIKYQKMKNKHPVQAKAKKERMVLILYIP